MTNYAVDKEGRAYHFNLVEIDQDSQDYEYKIGYFKSLFTNEHPINFEEVEDIGESKIRDHYVLTKDEVEPVLKSALLATSVMCAASTIFLFFYLFINYWVTRIGINPGISIFYPLLVFFSTILYFPTKYLYYYLDYQFAINLNKPLTIIKLNVTKNSEVISSVWYLTRRRFANMCRITIPVVILSLLLSYNIAVLV